MRLPLFDFMPVILQFYESDEEFPPGVKLMWDENVTDYMKYETVWYAAGFIYNRLLSLMGVDVDFR